VDYPGTICFTRNAGSHDDAGRTGSCTVYLPREKEPEEVAIGLIGQFWRPNGNLQKFTLEEFEHFKERGFCKGLWTFRLVKKGEGATLLETETRVFCTDKKSLSKFSRYWLFIKPFSGLIRNEILRGIKNKAERTVNN